MAFKDILKEMSEGESLDFGIEEIEDPEVEEVEVDEIDLGSMVKITDLSSFVAEDFSMSDEEFEELQAKVEAGESAIVFDVIDDNPELVNIVFADGDGNALEVFRIPKLNLQVVDYDEDEEEEPTLPVPED